MPRQTQAILDVPATRIDRRYDLVFVDPGVEAHAFCMPLAVYRAYVAANVAILAAHDSETRNIVAIKPARR